MGKAFGRLEGLCRCEAAGGGEEFLGDEAGGGCGGGAVQKEEAVEGGGGCRERRGHTDGREEVAPEAEHRVFGGGTEVARAAAALLSSRVAGARRFGLLGHQAHHHPGQA